MPTGTKVDKLYQKLKAKGLPVGEAAAIAQKQTKLSLATGKRPKTGPNAKPARKR